MAVYFCKCRDTWDKSFQGEVGADFFYCLTGSFNVTVDMRAFSRTSLVFM